MKTLAIAARVLARAGRGGGDLLAEAQALARELGVPPGAVSGVEVAAAEALLGG